MKVELLSTGTELLRGKNVDTNAAWLARQLGKAGLEVCHHQTVDDHFGRLVDSLKLAASRSDLLIMTGGLGPTEDDYTRAAAEEAFHRPLVYKASIWKAIETRFRKYKLKMASINKRQAWIPKGAALLPNPNGTAPGFLFRQDGVVFAALPGPPREMQPMFRDHVLPRIRTRADFAVWECFSYGLPEGTVDEIVNGIVGKRATYGLTVRIGQVNISIRAEGARRKQVLADLSRRVRIALGPCYMDAELHEVVVRELIARKTTLAVAESCTGGLIAHRLTEVPGVSEVLLESVVTYSNASKVKRLGVDPALIGEHGAVSEPVARAMARGVARTSGAQIGVAVTGIAGPGGGSGRKPVGLCYMAVGDRVESKVFSGDRSNVKERAAGYALNMLRLRLIGAEGNAAAAGPARKTVGVRPRR
ncbi:MAG TPA: CinA family nicotinamide mononucleotide deamidase-related protein [Planctomycetota bacterium]|nr:CinA family nicotinamide mononucleotide deamidase-related protein [Planctomycetota bacterium]